MSYIISMTVMLLLWMLAHGKALQEVITISGRVIESSSRNPVSGARISIPTLDLSPVFTDEDGRFKLFVVSSSPFELLVTKEGYSDVSRQLDPRPRIELNFSLVSIEGPQIEFSEFRSQSHIDGSVQNLPSGRHEDYKILVYVLTDKWYIHPYAVNVDGRGFASVKSDGTWRIQSVWRGYQAYRLALILTKKTYSPPSTVEVISTDADAALLARVENITSLIMDAPTGI